MRGLRAVDGALLAWRAWREPRRRVWTVWQGHVPIAVRRTRAEATRMIAAGGRTPRTARAAVDARYAPPGGPPPVAAGQPWLMVPPHAEEHADA